MKVYDKRPGLSGEVAAPPRVNEPSATSATDLEIVHHRLMSLHAGLWGIADTIGGALTALDGAQPMPPGDPEGEADGRLAAINATINHLNHAAARLSLQAERIARIA